MLGCSAMPKAKRKMKKKASKKAGRTPWTEARYEEKGISAIKLRIPTKTVELLSEEALAVGESRSVYVGQAVRERAARHRKLSQ